MQLCLGVRQTIYWNAPTGQYPCTAHRQPGLTRLPVLALGVVQRAPDNLAGQGSGVFPIFQR